ncbi:MAG: dTMP kinase [Succinivibrio sp.]|jgi:dTMP kinase|nr:dTMP kinase [Succinivibrio sp.]MBR1612788.1 dTMP kinase [Succinivibrio sp.]
MAKGLFITLEGSEGSGKSTQIEVIKNYLLSRGHKVECVREPGGTPIAEDIRALLKEIREDDRLCDKAELLLMYAARAQLVQTFIKPKLESGIDIICDRHDLSTIAYQGGGRQMNMADIDALRQVVLGSFRPDLTILLDLDVKVGMARARNRGTLDRFEVSKIDFFERVRQAYLDFAKAHEDYVKVISAEDPIETVSQNILKLLEKY